MLIKIGETQWIKAKKINAVQLCKKPEKRGGFACMQAHVYLTIARMITRRRPCGN